MKFNKNFTIGKFHGKRGVSGKWQCLGTLLKNFEIIVFLKRQDLTQANKFCDKFNKEFGWIFRYSA